MEDLTQLAVETAQEAGASYADARFVREHDETIQVKNGSVTGLSSRRNQGRGIRVIADGAWGFASTTTLTPAAIREAAKLAVRIARASATTKQHDLELSEVEPARAKIKANWLPCTTSTNAWRCIACAPQ